MSDIGDIVKDQRGGLHVVTAVSTWNGQPLRTIPFMETLTAIRFVDNPLFPPTGKGE